MSQRNEELFFAVADRVEFDEESYLQTSWGRHSSISLCGSRGCVAGNALLLSGYRLTHEDSFLRDGWRDIRSRLEEPWAIRKEAAELLGLTRNEADCLFNGSWAPAPGLTVPDALRLLGKGERLRHVTAKGSTADAFLRGDDG